jgi:malonate-semialdehyde dehydrogenase (acetylating) / methylmalonate-semialdehyde dehydrogenase
MTLVQHWIAGKSHDGTPERLGEVYNPATGDVTKQVAFAGAEIVDEAVKVAEDAFASWRETSVTKRAWMLFRFRDLIVSHKEDLARIITEEHGKVHSDALGEVQRGLEVVEFACGISHLQKGEFSENVTNSVDSYSIRQPLGVVAGITPFNFPAMVPMWMYPVAIACGNVFILKPSEKDPSASILMAELLQEAGLPDGVFNVVHGDKVAVDALLDHPRIAAVSSVGSTPVARYIYEQAARSGKRVQALGGAKNHMVVMPDADMDLAADSIVGAAYGSAGERCMAVSAVVAVGEAGDALLERVRERLADLRVGPGNDDESEMGPLVTSAHRDKVLSFIETGINEGADLAIDGRDVTVEGHDQGFYLGPCLFDHVAPEMTIYQEEIFGPVLSMLRTDDYEEAVELVNANPYGNGVAIFTNEGGTARRFQHEVQVGMVGINVPIPVPMAFFSFGGWKSSMFGDSHVYGSEGIRFYTRLKVVTTRWPDQPSTGASLHFPTH